MIHVSFLGIIDSGLGETHVTKFLSSLGIKPLHHRALKTGEMETGVQIERFAKESCRTALFEEASLTCPEKAWGERNLSSVPKLILTCLVMLGGSDEAAGKAIAACQGMELNYGAKSGKIIDYETRIKQCRICENASRKAKVLQKHNCQKNWNNTAKSMEANQSMVKRHTGKEEQVKRVAMDNNNNNNNNNNNATTASNLKKEIEGEISEMKDLGHCKKNLRSHTWKICKGVIKN